MYAVKVIPIQRGLFRDHLTFFSRDDLPQGAVVSVPIRKRSVPALVISSSDIREQKLDLKAAGFALKKLGKAVPRRVLSQDFMRALAATAEYHGAPDGATVATLTFAGLMAEARKLEPALQTSTRLTSTKPEVLLLQADITERMTTYRNLARECFAHGRSLMIIAPSLIEVEELARELARGIEEQVIILTSDVPKAELRKRWNRAVAEARPVLIIGTPPALSVPRANLDAIVVERESARAYKGRERPHLDMRRAAEFVARELGARLVLADFPVRVETRYRVEAGTAEDFARPQVRPSGHATVSIIDARTADTTKKERRSFTPLSAETLTALKEELGRKGRAAVFAARRGIAPLTVCNDCGTPVTDPTTGIPMTLHKTPDGNMFISSRSGAVVPANISCRTCGGWNLVTLGVGVDRVYDELKKHFPHTPLTLFTQDTAPTHRVGKKLHDSFYATQSGIIVGTERMLPYITEPVGTTIVATIDSILSSSAWRAHEHALQILYYLRTRAENVLLVETRKPDSEVMKALESGNPMDFYRTDIVERRTYDYPPFSTFIGLSWTGTEAECKLYRSAVIHICKGLDLVGPLPAELVERGRMRERAVIRVPEHAWPDTEISEKLKDLPPGIDITVDPDEIV